MESVGRVRALAGVGLEGDRYATNTGHYPASPDAPRDLTLIESEVLAHLARDGIQLAPGATRRNLTTSGIRLNDLVGRRFRIGDVACVGTRLCEPCIYLGGLVGLPLVQPLLHRGGLRARILSDGEITVGDAIAAFATAPTQHPEMETSIVDHIAENAAARQRILNLVRDLTDGQLLAPVDHDWTIAAELAHLAFWDRVHIGRLRRALADGLPTPLPLPDGIADIINDGELPAWRRLAGRDAVNLFETASADADRYLTTLDPIIVESVRTAGAPRLIERFRHRTEHGGAIERALRVDSH